MRKKASSPVVNKQPVSSGQLSLMGRLKGMGTEGLLMVLPLIALLPMLITRVFPFVAANEEPKWAVLVLCGLSMGLVAAAGW